MTHLKRSNAARLIEEISQYVADEINCPAQPPSKWALELRRILRHYEVTIPIPCDGEAHSGANIDNCAVCQSGPNWGWIGGEVKVR